MPESPSVLSSPAGCVGIWLSPAAGWTYQQGQEAAPHLDQPQRGGIPGTFSPWY